MHFFKIFQSSVIKDKRLELPEEFSRKFGKELCKSEHAIIEVPNGIWHIRMRKAKGAILFEDGWPELMEFYSIRVGHLMVFRYDGNSKFQVHIFGKSATEIEYPSHFVSTKDEFEALSDHSNDVEVISVHPAEAEIISVHSSSTQSNDEPSMSASSEGHQNRIAECLRSGFPLPSQQQNALCKISPKRSFTTAFQASRLQEGTLEAAKEFTTDNPFFKTFMRPSYVNGGYMRVPLVFATSHLKNRKRMERRMATLRVSDGRTWEVGYVFNPRGNRGRGNRGLYQGWRKFVSDNHLKEGDVCVFELVDWIKVEMNVHIFRV